MEENKKTEVNTEVKNTEVKTEGRRNDNRNRKFDKKRPRNNNRTSKPKSDLEDKVIEIRRVTKVVKGGRQFRFAATVVVGNRKGLVGLGTGKAKEMPDAVKKATQAASKNLINVELIKFFIDMINYYGAYENPYSYVSTDITLFFVNIVVSFIGLIFSHIGYKKKKTKKNRIGLFLNILSLLYLFIMGIYILITK